MSPSARSKRKNTFDRLATQIELLQSGFRSHAKAATLKELAVKLTNAAEAMFKIKSIECAHRPRGEEAWVHIVGGKGKDLDALLVHPDEKTSEVWEIYMDGAVIVATQRLSDKSRIALVMTGRGVLGAGFGELEFMSLRLILSLFDAAYQEALHRRSEKGLIFSLNHRILQLNSLIDTGIEVSTLDETALPHRLALVRAASLTNASSSLVRVEHNGEVREEYTFPEGGAPHTEKRNIISSSFTFSGETYTFELFDKESRAGIIAFEDTDQLILDALARQVYASLENRYLHRQELEKKGIEKEIAVAASIQRKIMPVSLPPVPGYDIAGTNIPTKFVGGDYYDCIPLPDGRYALVVADVTGKGVSAALLVSTLHAYLAAYLELSNTLIELLEKLNKALCNATTDDKFVTAFIVLMNPATGEMEYSSAGHNPGYIHRKDGKVEEINIGGPPLGAFDFGFPFKSARVTLEKGDRLFLYTDGVTEATNHKDELYDHIFPLPDFLPHHRPLKAETFIQDLILDIKKFTGSAPQSDDITVLYVSRNP